MSSGISYGKKSKQKLNEVVTKKLPKVPTYKPWDYSVVEPLVYNEEWLRKEAYSFRKFTIEPPAEAAVKKEKKTRKKKGGALGGLLGGGLPMAG